MLNGYPFRLYPNPEQEPILLQWIGCQRLRYNAKVQEDRYCRRFARHMVGTAGMPIPVDQEYRRFITERTAFLRTVPPQILRNGAAKFRQAYQRFFKKLGGRPKIKKTSGRQAGWLTKELFVFIPPIEETGAIASYQLSLGTKKFPVGVLPYMAHRPHSVPSSLHIAVAGGRWGLSFAAEDDTVGMAEKTVDATMKQIAEDLRHLSPEQLAERTRGGDRGIAKPLMTSDGQIVDWQPIHKTRIQKKRQRRKKWQKIAAKRRKGSKNQQKAYRKAARYQPYEKHVRHEYAHQTRHQLVANDSRDLSVCEDLTIPNMTKRPKAKRDAHGRLLPNGRQAKADLNRAILAPAWGQVVLFTTYKALRNPKLVITVPFAYSAQECAVCPFPSPDNRKNQAAFVCQRCGHRDNADHHAACMIAKRGITKLLSGEPLTKTHKTTRIFRTLGPERSEVTPGETDIRHAKPKARTHTSQNQELLRVTSNPPASTS